MTIIFFLFIFLLTFTAQFSSSTQVYHNRRILHQPFFPLDSLPPSIQPPFSSPQSQPQPQQPKYPFSSQSPPYKQTFFPVYPSPPPPPSTTALATFPANISSLILPQSSSSKPGLPKACCHRRCSFHPLRGPHRCTGLLSSLLTGDIAASLTRKPQDRTVSGCFRQTPPPRTADTSLRVTCPTPARSFFSLVLLLIRVESMTTITMIPIQAMLARRPCRAIRNWVRPSSSRFHHCHVIISVKIIEMLKWVLLYMTKMKKKKRSSSRQEGLRAAKGVQSVSDQAPRECFGPWKPENFGSRSLNSRTASYPSSNSASPTPSMSSSPFMPMNLSPRSLRSKSPDSVVDFLAPSRPPPAIPPLAMTPSPPKSNDFSPSSPSSPLESISGKSHNSPRRLSDVSRHSRQSPARMNSFSGQYVAIKLPPPPPPPPPPRFWETPVMPKLIREPITGPPVLITPSRSVVFQNPAPVLPSDQAQKLEAMERNEATPRPKLKPLHWDKVRASSDRAMVWDQLKSSSFQLNEEMIETLFMVNSSNLIPKDNMWRPVLPTLNQENRVLDPKKSQNIAILLRALNVTIDEVCEALLEGNADTLGTELLESLLKMAPTKEEERKLKEFKDESPFKLGPAEKFLKAVLDIPFAFKRVDAMLYIANFDSEVEYLKRSFETLEVACEELRNSRMFLKLLEAVLKTGNRMNVGTNRGDAHAFKLDTLLKLVDVKGTDGKTTLLHFVVQEIIRAEGSRLSGVDQNLEAEKQSDFRDDVEFRKLGLQVVSGLSGELTNVKKAAAMDSDVLCSEVAKLARGITKAREVVKLNEELALKENSRNFSESMNGFLKKAEQEITKIQAQETVALSLVKEITEYFHGNSVREEAHPFRIFMVVRDFLSILDQVCKEVGKINERTIVSSARQFPLPANPSLPPVFPGFTGRRQYSSSDDESPSSP
ncbi:hypothetical protein F0562_006704 [Nyssa sinensis]|uniref:Formin-like protein n=1 Tax=Nyssa sinensis TaxID=561372 RepID=A0A5J5APC7_9ASTE|nr:hypothetical protein F0562_006704 [Nyssa sinensis]